MVGPVHGLLAICVCAGAAFAQAQSATLSDAPPRASLIQLSAPDGNNKLTIAGAPGSVPGGSTVVALTIDTGHYATVRAGSDGSFSQTTFAPAGTSLLVKVDPTAPQSVNMQNLARLAGTVVRVPEGASIDPGIAFAGAGPTRAPLAPLEAPTFTLSGKINASQFQPGGSIEVMGTLEVRSSALQSSGDIHVSVQAAVERLSEAGGAGSAAFNIFSSVFLTPTGLTLDRAPNGFRKDAEITLVRSGSDLARATLNLSIPLRSDLAAGFYRPYLVFDFGDIPLEPLDQPRWAQVQVTARRPKNQGQFGGIPASLYLPVIRVGDPATPRLFWTLLLDTSSNGTRGVVAMEDRSRFGLSQRIVTPSDVFIIPRLDPITGQPAVYRLDPFLPTMAAGDRGNPPNPPLVPLRFPSGSLTVRIQRPDGSTVQIGPAPFAQSRMRAPLDRDGVPLSETGSLTDAYELSTMDSRFEVTFAQDGRHVITAEGWVEDIWGNRWNGGGTYEVFVAGSLSLDTAVLPGSVFEVGDVLTPGLAITPPVPANVKLRVRLAPNSDPKRMIDRTIEGRANRFGYFSPSGQGFRFDEPGEYRVDLTATSIDGLGNWRMGSRTWGGVVAPRTTSIIAHGRRGLDGSTASGQSTPAQWFFRTDTGVKVPGGHLNFPFKRGDVVWAQRSDSDSPKLTFEDPTGNLVKLLGLNTDDAAVGEIKLGSYSPENIDPLFDPTKAAGWGYSYTSAQRPLVRVREIITQADGVPNVYWSFKEHYAGQIGSARTGDLPNDIKFQYGGAVLRGTALATPLYAIYGSLFVLVPDDDPGGGSRIFPPFQGNGGGQSGGPIMKLKGKEIDLFVHLTGVRPGSILEVGDNVSISGAIGPPFPAQVSTRVTTPSGRIVQFSGSANLVGYYYHPENDFVVDEQGRYIVDVRVTFEGQTSVGPVTQPFPTGDVLGSADGRFSFYVVPRDSAPLSVLLPNRTILPAPAQLDITASAPPGFTITGGHVTTMMPGFLLQEQTLTSSNGQIAYHYDPVALARDFPNLDLNPPADVITISLFAQGTNSVGQPAYAAAAVVLHGQELFNLYGPVRHRAVRVR